MKTSEEMKRREIDDNCLAEVGFMFEGSQPTKAMQFAWEKIRVVLHVIDDEPGAVQSGHYLWPAAKMLADHLVEKELANKVESVVELGAGCALASLTALQAWQPNLQCVVVTDHDPGVLERARSNHESTLNELYEQARSEDGLNNAINDVGSIPVVFEFLEWGNDEKLENIRNQLLEHTISGRKTADVLLGTDLIYSQEVVEPLLHTAAKLMHKSCGRFLSSQSFLYDKETETTIDMVCTLLHLERTTLQESEDGTKRIQEFRFVQKR